MLKFSCPTIWIVQLHESKFEPKFSSFSLYIPPYHQLLAAVCASCLFSSQTSQSWKMCFLKHPLFIFFIDPLSCPHTLKNLDCTKIKQVHDTLTSSAKARKRIYFIVWRERDTVCSANFHLQGERQKLKDQIQKILCIFCKKKKII